MLIVFPQLHRGNVTPNNGRPIVRQYVVRTTETLSATVRG